MQSSEKPKKANLLHQLKLLPYNEIRKAIISNLSNVRIGTEVIYVDAGQGRILAEDAVAVVNVPTMMQSAMDGYAIRSLEAQQASSEAPARFKILRSISQNSNRLKTIIKDKECHQVSTGSPLPEGADAVVRIEEAKISDDGNNMMITRPVMKGKNVVCIGQDIQRGQTLLPRARMLNGVDVALLISAGFSRVRVIQIPRVGIISIGDELKEFEVTTTGQDGSPEAFTVNNFFNMMVGFFGELGIQPNLIGISQNNIHQIRQLVESNVSDYDLILTIGGSSVGERDYAKTALSSVEKSKIIFHGVRMVPIKPAGLALVKNKPIVIVPAHASSTAFTFFMVVLPVLNIMSGLSFDSRKLKLSAVCNEQIVNSRALDALALVELERREDRSFHASHLGWYSNLISAVSKAHGFILMKAREIIHESQPVEIELLGTSQLGRIK